MKLVQQHNQNTQTNNFHTTLHSKQQYYSLQPFKKFQSSVSLGIKINFGRFLFVIFVFYYSDVLLVQNQKNSTQPWNSLLYFLAMMIETIKFIGDCSLIKHLKKEQKSFVQYLELKNSQTQTGNEVASQQVQQIKKRKFEDYLSIYRLVDLFKYTDRNYSSAFTISKYMHLICIFSVFGWMALKQQFYLQTNLLQLLTLQVFLVSIYISSFEIDFYLTETSQGKICWKDRIYSLEQISQNEKQIILINFNKWRENYLLWQNIGTVLLTISLIFNFQLSIFTFTCLLVVVINFLSAWLERDIKKNAENFAEQIKRQHINYYSILKHATLKFRILFKIFIVGQRISFLFLWFCYARDIQMNIFSSILSGLGIFLLFYSQRRKFMIADSSKIKKLITVEFDKDIMNEGKQIQCAICLKQIQKSQRIKFLPCSKQHIYHDKCFQDWKKVKNQCPICRYSLKDYI